MPYFTCKECNKKFHSMQRHPECPFCKSRKKDEIEERSMFEIDSTTVEPIIENKTMKGK